MDPISKLTRAFELARLNGSGSSKARGSRAQRPANEAPGVTDAKATLQRKLRAIDPDQPGGRDLCVRLVLEHMLVREFGAETVRSAAMQQTLIDVQTALDSDDTLRAELDQIVRSLQQENPPR